MDGNRQMEMHYMNTGFPYTATESFTDFFDGLTHMPVNYPHAGPIHDQVLHFIQHVMLPVFLF